MTDIEKRVIELMKWYNVISDDVFDIEEIHLKCFMDFYKDVSKTNGHIGSMTNKRYARKLAGRTLLNHVLKNGGKYDSVKSGIVYLISNPVFPDFYKVGMTINLSDRLKTYQTSDPYRRYKVEKYDFVLDRVRSEQKILYSPESNKVDTGEWISSKIAIRLFDRLISKPHNEEFRMPLKRNAIRVWKS